MQKQLKLLKKINIKSILLTGDNRKVAEAVSKKLGMDSYYGGSITTSKIRKNKRVAKQR